MVRKDEIGRLVDAFNKMAQKLRSHYSEIANTKEKLMKTDDELKKAGKRLPGQKRLSLWESYRQRLLMR